MWKCPENVRKKLQKSKKCLENMQKYPKNVWKMSKNVGKRWDVQKTCEKCVRNM